MDLWAKIGAKGIVNGDTTTAVRKSLRLDIANNPKCGSPKKVANGPK